MTLSTMLCMKAQHDARQPEKTTLVNLTFWSTLLHVAMLCVALGCGGSGVVLLPAPTSPPPAGASEGLRAGFARVDITPPPGFGLGGYGPDAQQAVGYRHRLYVRALVLEDRNGQRLALAVADLGHLSSLLHRRTAAQLQLRNTGIGADRLILSATHTHSGPGNVYEARQYNTQTTPLAGYDPNMATFLVSRLAQAIENAVADLEPAVAAWDTLHVNVTGLTRNRSLDAFVENDTLYHDFDPDEDLAYAAVNKVWTMLRVDRCDDDWANCTPKGAYSIFAIHGTGYPQATDLADGDVHALAERGLERHLEKRNPSLARGFRSGAFHLFANGTEGDVSPDHDPGTRCEEDNRLEERRSPGGPRRPPAPEAFWTPPRRLKACLERARLSTNRIGDGLTRAAVRLFDKMEGHLEPDLEITRAFATLSLKGLAGSAPLCPEPRIGAANLAGAEDGRPPIYKWKVLGFIPTGIEEGGRAIRKKPRGCHGAKKIPLGILQGLFIGNYFVGLFGLPEYAQLSVVQIGPMLLAALPGEITTEAGARMRQAILDAGPSSAKQAVVISLANGFLQYVTTAEEYAVQQYEGGSTIYGPNTAQAFTENLVRLAGSLRSQRPVVEVEPILSDLGPTHAYLAPPDNGPPVEDIQRTVESTVCRDHELIATWIDAYPGRLIPADGQVLEIQRERSPGNWQRVAWDDDRSVEVRAKKKKKKGYLWEVRWVPEKFSEGTFEPDLESGRYRVVLTARDSLPEVPGEPVNCH